MTWMWDLEWITNLASLAVFGSVALLQVFTLWRRNSHRRRDRLVWGLIGWNGAIVIGYWWASLIILGVIDNVFAARVGVRFMGISAGLFAAFAIWKAPPLIYADELDTLRAENDRLKAEMGQRPTSIHSTGTQRSEPPRWEAT